ncbi:hypothetical protein HOD82_02110 [bacterium]|nr:hypothetical protein [bacterium]MBT4251124.1 hypothetical protein [bacterium]
MGGNQERVWKPVFEIDTSKEPFLTQRMPKPGVLHELFRLMLNLRVVHYVTDDFLEEYSPSLAMLAKVEVSRGFNVFVKKNYQQEKSCRNTQTFAERSYC